MLRVPQILGVDQNQNHGFTIDGEGSGIFRLIMSDEVQEVITKHKIQSQESITLKRIAEFDKGITNRAG